MAAGRGYYTTHPIPGKPLRLVVLDSANSAPEGIGQGSEGWCDLEQGAWLEQELAAAAADHEVVVVLSHHRPEDFSGDSPVSGEQIRAVLAASPNVVLHLTGHGHANVKRLVPPEPADGSGGYWQLMAASPVDFPLQSRIVELVDEGNGFLSIYVTNLDHNAPEGSLAHYARQLAAAKLAFGPGSDGQELDVYWQNQLQSQNILLRQALPTNVAEELGQNDWPARIESIETLQQLE